MYDGIYGGTFPMLKKATEDYSDIWKNEKGANFEWWILTWTLKNHKNLHFNRILLSKTYNVWAKKSADELCLMALKIGAKFEGKLACAFQNDMKNLTNFYSQVEK